MSLGNISTIHPTKNSSSNSASSAANSEVGFYEIGAFGPNVKRVRDGADQLEETKKMAKERIEIELKYGQSLHAHYQKWNNYSEKQLPENSIKTAFDGILSESKELARVHLGIKDRLNDEIVKTIGLFKKDNYHHSALRGFKEPKEIEDEFEKAQRQWKKLYERVEAAKHTYHSCCRSERSAYIQMVNSQGDSTFAQDGADKTRDRYEKCRKNMEKAKSHYEQQLREISHFNSVYIENMTFVFEKCQQMELKRMKFIVEMLSGMQKILVDLVTAPKLNQIHRNLVNTFNTLGEQQLNVDLRKWSLLHGTEAPVKWPVFEDYKQEFRNITAVTPKLFKGEGGVILTKKTLKSDDGDAVVLERRNSFSQCPTYDSSQHQQNFDEQNSTMNSNRNSTMNSNYGSEMSYLPAARNGPYYHHQAANNFVEMQNRSNQMEMDRNSQEKEEFSTIPSTNCHSRTAITTTTGQQHNGANPPTDNGNGGAHRLVLSCDESVQDTTTNSDPPSKPTSVNGEISTSTTIITTTKPMNPLSKPIVINNGEASSTGNVLTTKPNGFNNNESSYPHPQRIIQSTTTKKTINGLDDGGGAELMRNEGSVVFDDVEEEQEKGLPVQVLYSYDPLEDDELKLIKGEILEFLSGPDNLGWCRGRKKNIIGYFPDGYVRKL